ncbi:trimethylamine corrinoid protein 2 [Candidatus Epulonipiscium viviparus]|uniref:trimethylamine corrinoid protein 2 n=1 Tax=Candidatus Epulonipiscium viviparus TaxID=420336 RepID=UPI00016C074C|nr:trimethylamine corrinoid protein 2 [Candidatus Epulopiscium viviparus]
MRFKEDIDIVRKRIDAFWANELMDRALVSILTPKEKGKNIPIFDAAMAEKDPAYVEKFWFDPQTIHNRTIKQLENTYLGGDALPTFHPDFGVSGHAAFFGCKPIVSPKTIWFNPAWSSLSDWKTTFAPEVIQQQVAIIKEVARLSNGDYFIGLPDHCGTLDAVGHLYGTDNVLMAMITDPEELQEALAAVDAAWVESIELFYQALKEVNKGSCHSWMHLLSDKKMGQMQCDMSVMFSAELYEEFVYDELKRQIAWFDDPIYHFDGAEQERHLDILLSFDKLKVIQWTPVAGQPKASHFMPILKRIQDAGKRLVIGVIPEEIPDILENLSAKGLNLRVRNVKDPDAAAAVVKCVEKYSKS